MQELGLALGGVPQKVVHLTAANEHRQNFSLTDISSSVQARKGYELVLPGVHSNIGGSYGELTTEEERDLNDAERDVLIAQGWYKDNEIQRTAYPIHSPETGQLLYITYSAVGRRLGLTWEYQYMPNVLQADRFLIVGVQKKFPHEIWLVELSVDAATMAQGRKKYQRLLEAYAQHPRETCLLLVSS